MSKPKVVVKAKDHTVEDIRPRPGALTGEDAVECLKELLKQYLEGPTFYINESFFPKFHITLPEPQKIMGIVDYRNPIVCGGVTSNMIREEMNKGMEIRFDDSEGTELFSK
jgi:hypothetical protein